MPLDTERSRGNPEYVLFLDPFEEPLRYFVIELGHGTMVCFVAGPEHERFVGIMHKSAESASDIQVGRKRQSALTLMA